MTALNLNANGWTTPNPLLAKVTFTCPAGAWNCDHYPFSLNIHAAEGRFYFYETSLPPDATNCYGDYPAEQTTYNTFTLMCNSYSLLAGDTVSHTWKLWIQPSDATTLNVEATYGTESDTALVSVPRAGVYPVVVIPGFLGSWKNFSGEWVIDPLLGTYNILLEELRRVGYEDGVSLFTFPYDWRQPVADNGGALGSGIDGFLQQAVNRPYVRTDRVDIISHSMGGLVSRAYIQSNAYGNDVRRLITLGTPHLGAPGAYLSAEGLVFEPSLMKAIASHLAKKAGYCTLIITPKNTYCFVTDADLHHYIRERLPSVRDLFPDRRYLAADVGGYLVDNSNPSRIYPFGVQVNTFLESLNAEIGSLVSRLGAGNIIPVVGVGNKEDTDLYYHVIGGEPEDTPLWANGKVPPGDAFRKQGLGDQTVPSASADLGLVDPRIQSLVFSQTDNGQAVVHRHLPTQFQLTSPERLVGIRPPFDAGFTDPLFQNPILFFNLSPVEIQVIDPLGRRAGVDFETWGELAEIPGAAFWRSDVPGEPDFLFIAEPIEGGYTIRLMGTAEGQYTTGMDALAEDGYLNVVTFSGATAPGLQHEHRLTYDREALPALPLTLEWLPPLEPRGTPLQVQSNRTLPIKFTVRDAEGNFVIDPNVMVWVLDPLMPGQAIAAFTTESPDGRSAAVRIDEREEHYIVNLRLRDYPFQVGKTYLVSATVFGQSFETTAFMVVR